LLFLLGKEFVKCPLDLFVNFVFLIDDLVADFALKFFDQLLILLHREVRVSECVLDLVRLLVLIHLELLILLLDCVELALQVYKVGTVLVHDFFFHLHEEVVMLS